MLCISAISAILSIVRLHFRTDLRTGTIPRIGNCINININGKQK